MSDSYAAAGVDIDASDRAVGAIVGALRSIEVPSRTVPLPGHYASVLRVSDELGIAFATDGVGSKLVVAEQTGRLETVGIDCVAMNVNDLVCVGAEPIALVDYLAVEEPDEDRLAAIARGIARGAQAANVEVPGGELAVLPELIKGHPSPHGFDLCASVIGTVRLDAIVTGKDVAPGAAGIGGPPALLRLDPASGRGQQLPLPPFTAAQFSTSSGRVSMAAPVPFAPELAWTLDADGRVWSGVTDRYRLRLHDPAGDTLRVVERAAAPVAVSAQERDSVPAQLKWFTDQGGRVDLSRVPKQKPAFLSIRTDDRGWLWVRPSLPAAEKKTAFDVFDPEGRYQGRLSLPVAHEDRMPLVIRGERIYAVVLNDEGVPQVVRFRIEGRSAAPARVAARR